MNQDDNLYKSLYDDDQNLDNDIGLNNLHEIYGHLDYEEMSKYYSIDQFNNTFPSNENNLLSIVHVNIRSIIKKLDKINIFFASLKKVPDVFCVSESWLTDKNINLANLDGFKGYHMIRTSDHEHGGVSCFVRNSLESEFLEEFSFVNEIIEICSVRVKLNDEYYVISTIYRPSSKYNDVDLFNNRLADLLKNNIFKKSKRIMIGDFNINLLEFSSHTNTKNS